jgi:unsaturated rhamnogalacturonyl hydrolase
MRQLMQIGIRAAIAVALLLVGGCGPGHPRLSLHPSPEAMIRTVADRVLADFPEPPPFNWGEGVLMAGMMRAGTTLDEPRYVEFVRTWADHWQNQGLASVLEGSADGGLPNYCGHWGPGYPVVLLYDHTSDPGYRAMALQVADFVLNRGTRLENGGFGHWGGNYQLWVDTLYMVCPLFVELAPVAGRPGLEREAVRQLEIYAGRLQDEQSGLFWHMYDEPSGKRVGVQWARGNGWVAMSYVAVLTHLDEEQPEYDRLSRNFRRQMKALLKVQDPNVHFWHTVLDDPGTYLETSASAMIIASLADAHRAEIFMMPRPRDLELKWAALSANVDEQGHVINVSGGTAPDKPETYAGKVRGTYTWGTGAFLLAACALHEGI